MNTGLQVAAFYGFFTATAAGFAALLGLLFVAFTLRWQEIGSNARLRFTAIGSTEALVGGLMVSLCVLLPGQGPAAVGWEIVGLSALFALASLLEASRLLKERPLSAALWMRIASIPIVFAAAVGAGASLIAGSGPGLYLEAGLFITAFPVVTWNAWEAVWPPESHSKARKHH